jgi:hypothetical protein
VKFTWKHQLIVILLVISGFFFALNYLLFKDLTFMTTLVTLQLAMMPISVIILTFVLGRYIAEREREQRLDKLSMLIDVFFGEMGGPLLAVFACMDPNRQKLFEAINISNAWKHDDYRRAREFLKRYECNLVVEDLSKLSELRALLEAGRSLHISLMENPMLLEHQSFTELMRAIFHLGQELSHRSDLDCLPPSDIMHLVVDIKRAYSKLLPEWLMYMEKLSTSFPYFYSLETRMSPLNPNASPEVLADPQEPQVLPVVTV